MEVLFDNIPETMQSVAQWVLWREENWGDGNIRKVPRSARNPHIRCDITDPGNWASFRDAVKTIKAHPDLDLGLGFVLANGFVGIDVDAEKQNTDIANRTPLVAMIANASTYKEISPSGKGFHAIARAQGFFESRKDDSLRIEMYAGKRYFTVTGNVIGECREVTEQPELIQTLAQKLRGQIRSDIDLESITDFGRRLDLSDADVLERAMRNQKFAQYYRCNADNPPIDWSGAFLACLNVLDRITGEPDQVRRIIMRAPLVIECPPKAGEPRVAKAARLFESDLQNARARNQIEMAQEAHGRQIAKNLQETKRQKSVAQSLEWLEKNQDAEGAYSPAGQIIAKEFEPYVGKIADVSEVPPGRIGRLVESLYHAGEGNYRKFLTPATFAYLSGLFGRAYKIGTPENGFGLNLYFFVGGPAGSGKSSAIKMCIRLDNFLSKEQLKKSMMETHAVKHVYAQLAFTPQGLHVALQDMPSGVWMADECQSQLDMFKNPDKPGRIDKNAEAFRSYFNSMFDASVYDGPRLAPMASITAKKDNDRDKSIPNANISLYGTTTPDGLDFSDKDVQSGFLSRVIVLRHTKKGERMSDDDDKEYTLEIAPDILETLTRIYQHVWVQDDNYKREPTNPAILGLIRSVSFEPVKQLRKELKAICREFAYQAQDNSIDPLFSLFARVFINAEKMAATMAVLENYEWPQVTREQLLWAYGYVLKRTAELFTSMHRGEMGSKKLDPVSVIERKYKEMMRSGRNKSLNGVIRNELVNKCRCLQPFSDATFKAHSSVNEIINFLIESGKMVEEELNGKSKLVRFTRAQWE